MVFKPNPTRSDLRSPKPTFQFTISYFLTKQTIFCPFLGWEIENRTVNVVSTFNKKFDRSNESKAISLAAIANSVAKQFFIEIQDVSIPIGILFISMRTEIFSDRKILYLEKNPLFYQHCRRSINSLFAL